MLNNKDDELRPRSPSLDNMMCVEDENPESNVDQGFSTKANALSLEKITQLINSQQRTPEELKLEYTELQLQNFKELKDAPLDDKKILENDLTKTHKPMALLNTLKQKEREDFLIEETSVQKADPFFGAGA